MSLPGVVFIVFLELRKNILGSRAKEIYGTAFTTGGYAVNGTGATGTAVRSRMAKLDGYFISPLES